MSEPKDTLATEGEVAPPVFRVGRTYSNSLGERVKVFAIDGDEIRIGNAVTWDERSEQLISRRGLEQWMTQ